MVRRRRKHLLRLAPLTLVASVALSGVMPPIEGRPRVESRVVDLAEEQTIARTVSPGWRRAVRLDASANAIGFDWEGAIPGAVETRALTKSGWTQWFEAHGNPDEGPDPRSGERLSRTGAGPLWFGSGVRQLEVRVSEGRLAGLRLIAIRSESPKPRLLSPSSAVATPSEPAIISRAEWGADESWRTYASGCDGTPKYASRVRNSFVHHTATANSYTADEAAAFIRAIYHFHTHAREFCDIGYNFLIDRFGRIYEGRYGGITKPVIGAHAGGFNTGSTGVALLGDHQTEGVPGAALSSLQRLLAWKLTYHSVDAGAQVQVTSAGSTRWQEGTVVTLSTVSGHRDVSATACPGDFAYPLLPQLRRDVQGAVMSTPPFPLPGWQPAATGSGVLTLDAYGGVHPVGSESAVTHAAHWSGWSIARGAVRDSVGGYVVDGWGGLHQYGDAPSRAPGGYWFGWDIVRGISRGPVDGSGWVLDGFGGLHAYGEAPPGRGGPYFPGFDIARAVVSLPTGAGGYVLDGFGGIHPFGAALPAVAATGYWTGWDIARAIALRADGKSGYVLDGWGGLHPFGGAPSLSVTGYTPGRDRARGLVLDPKGDGGWMVDVDGAIWPFGAASSLMPSLTWTGMGLGRTIVTAPEFPSST